MHVKYINASVTSKGLHLLQNSEGYNLTHDEDTQYTIYLSSEDITPE